MACVALNGAQMGGKYAENQAFYKPAEKKAKLLCQQEVEEEEGWGGGGGRARVR